MEIWKNLKNKVFRFTKLQPPDRQGFFLLYSVCFWFVLVKLLENDKNKQVITIHNSKIESISALKNTKRTTVPKQLAYERYG